MVLLRGVQQSICSAEQVRCFLVGGLVGRLHWQCSTMHIKAWHTPKRMLRGRIPSSIGEPAAPTHQQHMGCA